MLENMNLRREEEVGGEGKEKRKERSESA